MDRFFISYARTDKLAVQSLVSALETLNNETWIDRRLAGGQKWWEEILENIRRCDVFVVALSKHTLQSKACRLEYTYAKDLGKTILPVMVAGDFSVDDVLAEVAAVQFVDYRRPDEHAALALAKALRSLPKSAPLPAPLPAPPVLAPSFAITADPEPDAVEILPALVSRPLKAVIWTSIVFFVISPAAIISSAVIVAIVQAVFSLDESQPAPGWTLALAIMIGALIWRYWSSRFDRFVSWSLRRRNPHCG